MAPQLSLAQRKARMGGGGSSGVHAMDGQSGDGAREGETLGKGGSHPESETLGKWGVVMHTATKATTLRQNGHGHTYKHKTARTT